MSTNIYDFFCDFEELKVREPEYCARGPVAGDIDLSLLDGEGPSQAAESEDMPISAPQPAPAKTFVSILAEGCARSGNPSSVAQYTFTTAPDNPELFLTVCELGTLVSKGAAKTKKTSKQLAAKEMLLKLTDAGRHEQFGLLADKEAAKNFLNRLMPELATEEMAESSASSSENWVGRVNQICQGLKLLAPQYDIDDGTGQPPVFVAKCSISQVVTTGSGRTKKLAKTAAAQEMFEKLKNLRPMDIDKELLIPKVDEKDDPSTGDVSTSEKVESVEKLDISEEQLDARPTEFTISDPSAQEYSVFRHPLPGEPEVLRKVREAYLGRHTSETLLELLNSGEPAIEKIFKKQDLSFTDFTQRDAEGHVQCLLQLHGGNGEENVFPGTGINTEAAHDQACSNAIFHLEAFLLELQQ